MGGGGPSGGGGGGGGRERAKSTPVDARESAIRGGAPSRPAPAPSRPAPAPSRPAPAPSRPAPSQPVAVDARETAIARAAGATPSTGQMQFGGTGRAFTPVTTGTTVTTKPAQQITAGEVVKTFEDVRTTGERMAAGQTGLREGTTFAFNEKGKIVGKVVEKPALVPPALAVIRALTGQTDTMYQKTYTGPTTEPVSVGFRSEKMAGDIGTTAGAPTAAAIEKQKVQETMRGGTEPIVTPEVTPEVVPDESVLGAAATTARERRRTRTRRAGQAGTILEGFGALYQ
jgi:hypothetical protein